MATIEQLRAMIGREAFIRVLRKESRSELRMAVVITDVRRVYGRVEYHVIPKYETGGDGSAWVQLETLDRFV